jgi:putative ABC transport system permease protein
VGWQNVPWALFRGVPGQAWRNVRSFPLRSLLGALAVAVAVATMTLAMTAIDALALYARQSAARVFGADTFVVAQIGSPGRISRRELEAKLRRNPAIERREVRRLEALAGDRVLYAATAQRVAPVAAGGREFENAAVSGTGHHLPKIRALDLAEGRFFTADEERAAAAVAVIGRDVADTLWPGLDALGRSLRLGGRAFTVIGIQTKLGTAGGVSLDRYVWIPLPAFERVFGATGSLQLSARAPLELAAEGGGDRDARAALAVALAEDRARASLRATRQLRPGVDDNFDVLTPDAARSFVVALASRIGAAGPLLGAMALLASLVVVTNTTLVSVTQRTFDIGVRRAVGATRGVILAEVLLEAALVALLGGAAGVTVVALAVRLLAPTLELPIGVAPGTVAGALLAATATGLLAGWLPARRAARIDVVNALRSE